MVLRAVQLDTRAQRAPDEQREQPFAHLDPLEQSVDRAGNDLEVVRPARNELIQAVVGEWARVRGSRRTLCRALQQCAPSRQLQGGLHACVRSNQASAREHSDPLTQPVGCWTSRKRIRPVITAIREVPLCFDGLRRSLCDNQAEAPAPAPPMSTRTEIKTLWGLALPIVAAQLGTMMLGVFDMIMLGHFDTQHLAGSAIGHVWIFGTMIIAQGILLGADPRISQAHGAGNGERIGITLQAGLILGGLLCLPLAVAWWFTGEALHSMGVDPELSQLAGRYAAVQIPGIPFLLGYCLLRSWLQGRGIMKPAMWIVLLANVLNAFVNWVLVFGHLGFEPLGIVGAGCATTLTQAFMCLGLLLFVRVFRLQLNAWTRWSRLAWKELRVTFKLGWPIGMQFAFEAWAFQLCTLMAESLGTAALASHAIALNLASIAFMVPLGISIGASKRVGNLIGAGQPAGAQLAAKSALLMGAAAMLLAAATFILFSDQLPTLFNKDQAVVAAAAAILPIAGAFQLFDGLQVVAGGVVRGMGKTRVLAVTHFIAFYVVALPAAYYLAFERNMGLPGIWWGLCIGLGAVALWLCFWILRHGPASLPPDVPS